MMWFLILSSSFLIAPSHLLQLALQFLNFLLLLQQIRQYLRIMIHLGWVEIGRDPIFFQHRSEFLPNYLIFLLQLRDLSPELEHHQVQFLLPLLLLTAQPLENGILMLEFPERYLILGYHLGALVLETVALGGQLVDFIMKIEIILFGEDRIILVEGIIGIAQTIQTLHYNL